jgi:putative endonuclease
MFSAIFKRKSTIKNNQSKGLEGEQSAARFLKKSGLKILVPRYRCSYGEVDLVARDGDTLVFIEVKMRSSDEFGDPSLAVTPEKQKHISRVALDYLRSINHPEIPVRFDIVEVLSTGKNPECRHIRDAFTISAPYFY